MQNTPKKQLDYLIIGQGLAGSILSYRLLKMGKKVAIINRFDPKSASYIAGGIFSPIAGQRIAKIWQADEIYPQMAEFYTTLEKDLSCSFFHKMPYIKLLINDDLKKFAQRRLDDPEYTSFIKKIEHNVKGKKIDAIEIQHTGWMNTNTFLDTYRTFLEAQDAYIEDWFDVDQLVMSEKEIQYKNINAQKIVFANGLQATQNPFFNHHRFIPTKGELLTVKMNAPQNAIINGNAFVLPIGNGLFHVGATFAREFADTLPTQKGKEWLCTELEKLIDISYEIIDHKAGIRPTTPGHRPIVEWHEQHQNVGIFTGFGAKGVSYIPYCTQTLLA